MFLPKQSLKRFALISLSWMLAFPVYAQEEENEDIYELNPFVVKAGTDRGYLATNQISGTRVNALIKDTPVPLEVLTSEFLQDTGAVGFKESLAYSSGISTESYLNVANSGRDRSPSAASVGDRRNNAITIRGFNAPFQLRMGFRIGTQIGIRGGASDTGRGNLTLGALLDNVNTDRIEVVRGPAALLYGLGVISGIANVLPKTPLSEFMTTVQFGVGTDDFRRVALDTTGPIIKKDGQPYLDYRVMAAIHQEGDWTDYFLEKRDYYAGQLKWYPTRKIQVFAELQKGTTRFEGYGDQFINDATSIWRDQYGRSFVNEFGELHQWGRDDFAGTYPEIWNVEKWEENFGVTPSAEELANVKPLQGPFLPPSARITGPDTWYERDEWTAMLKVDMKLTDQLALSVGGFHSEQSAEDFDVNTVIFSGPDTDDQIKRVPEQYLVLNPNPLLGNAADKRIYRGVRSYWNKAPTKAWSDQFQADLRYEFETPFLFGSNAEHSLLIGRQDIQDEAELPWGSPTVNSTINDFNAMTYHSIGDWQTPLRYTGQPLASPAGDYYTSKLWFQGNYAVYQGKFFNDKMMIIAGIRHDRFQAYEEIWKIDPLSTDVIRTGTDQAYYNFTGPDRVKGEAVKVTTNTIAVSYALTPSLNMYAVMAEGVIPNTGVRDGAGVSIEPEQTLSKELGFKFDFFKGKISGTVSFFQIDRENAIWNAERAPTPGNWEGGRNPWQSGIRLDPRIVVAAGGMVDGEPDYGNIISYGINYHSYFYDKVNSTDAAEAAKWREKLGIFINPRTQAQIVTSNDPVLDENGNITRNPADGILAITPERVGNITKEPGDPGLTGDNAVFVYVTYDKLKNDPEMKAIMDQAVEDYKNGNAPIGAPPIEYTRAPGAGRLYGINASTTAGASNVTFEEEVRGIDGQIIFTPFDKGNFQIMFTFSHIKRKAVSAFKFVEARAYVRPELVDPSSPEYDPEWVGVSQMGSIGTEYDLWVVNYGVDNFTDPKDPSTLKGGIQGRSLYYGPETELKLWTRYTFIEGPLQNFGFGAGVRYIGSAQTYVPVTNNLSEELYPTPDTEDHFLFDAALYYQKQFEKFDLRLSVNFYNVFDKDVLYTEVQYPNLATRAMADGVIERRRTQRYINPFSMRVSVSLTF